MIKQGNSTYGSRPYRTHNLQRHPYTNEAKEQVQFLKEKHTYGSRPTCGSRQTQHADPLPMVKVKMDGAWPPTSTLHLFNASTANPTPWLLRSGHLLLSCYFSHVNRRPPLFEATMYFAAAPSDAIFNTITHCPAFPSRYMCYLSSHISHHFTMAVCPHYPRTYIPIEYFNSQFQWRWSQRKQNCPYIF